MMELVLPYMDVVAKTIQKFSIKKILSIIRPPTEKYHL